MTIMGKYSLYFFTLEFCVLKIAKFSAIYSLFLKVI